jgi:Rieske Fe-S protein
VAAPLLVAFDSLTRRAAALGPRPRRVTIPGYLQQDVTFLDGVIVCRTDAGVRALSRRCTHLGCEISHHADGLLVCPCHGSRFRLDGSVAQGPAARPLDILPLRVDPQTGATTVVVT